MYLVDGRVVDDLVSDVHLLGGELLAGLVRHLHGALHPPAVAVSLGQGDADVLVAPLVAVGPHLGHQPRRTAAVEPKGKCRVGPKP